MKRRTLDLIFSVGGLTVAVLALVLGLVLQSQANFAKTYVADQLSAQSITFTPEENLTEEEAQADCLIEYAGEQLTTGKQAECYANEYIGLHLTHINEGKTYSESSGESRALGEEARRGHRGRPDRSRCSGAGGAVEGRFGQGRQPVSWRDPQGSPADQLRLQHLRRAGPAGRPRLLCPRPGPVGRQPGGLHPLQPHLRGRGRPHRQRRRHLGRGRIPLISGANAVL